MDALQEALEILGSCESEEGHNIVINAAAKVQAIEEVLMAEAHNEIDEEEANQRLVEIVDDSAAIDLDILGLETMEEDGEMAEMMAANDDDIAEMSEGTFGDFLGQVLDENYEDSDEAIGDVMDATGLDEDGVMAILEDQEEPDAETLEGLGVLFPEYEKDFMGYLRANYSQNPLNQKLQAQFNQVRRQQKQLALQQQEMAVQQQIGDILEDYEEQANELIKQGYLLPSEKKELLGDFSKPKDRLACFSAMCEDKQSDPQSELDQIGYYLQLARKRGQLAVFSSQVAPVSNNQDFFGTQHTNEIQKRVFSGLSL